VDLRKTLRANLSFPVSCKIPHSNPELRQFPCRDVGAGGLCVLLPERLKDGTKVDVKFVLPQVSHTLSAVGAAVWQKEVHPSQGNRACYLTGLRFDKISSADRASLLTTLKNNLQKESEKDTERFLQAAMTEARTMQSAKGGRARRFTANPSWVDELISEIAPYRQAILTCPLLEEAERGTLSLKQLRAWLTQMYPFIESFPQWIAINLARTPDLHSRAFFIDNVRAEKRHAELWVHLANGFGVSDEELFNVKPIPEVDALTNWLWMINSRGSLPEGVAATNYAIEGIAQDISRKMLKGMPKYEGRKETQVKKETYWWLEEHAKYDDKHPLEALEVIKLYGTSPELQQKVKWATKRSLEYMKMLYDACYDKFKP